jgi:Protein-arginine deiminase (PAD)
MAGYLTHVMVLIKAEAWLGHLIAALERRRTTANGCLSEFEEAVLDLAQPTRALLRINPAAPQWVPAGTRIDNGVGTGLSKHALVGSIGMDFPINGHVLALSRDWVSRTMRIGSPRRAYVNADSTDFVLNFINALTDTTLGLDPLQQRAMRSYALGHLAGVAADVVLQPAINSWAWSDENRDHLDQHRFRVQLDARVAHGFFQRDDLRQGQSWEDYFLSSGDVERESEKLTTVFLRAFRDTYASTRPTSGICAIAASECRVPEITEGFLKDAYANTKNWAIGRGYDQSPWWWYKPLLGTFVLGGGMFIIFLIWGSTSTYNIEKWREGKGFETERLWFDLISNANTFAGVVYYPFTWLAKFPIFWSGIFGQGTIGGTERPGGKAFVSTFKGVLDVVSFLFDRVVQIAGAADKEGAFFSNVDPVVNEPYVRWPRFGVGLLLELLKTFWIDMGSAENGEEGDRLSFTMFWPVKIATFGTYFASVLIVFGAKTAASRRKADGTTEDEGSGWDYLIGLICPVVFISIAWGTKFYENKVMEGIVGVPWPGTDTGAVDRYLPEATIAPFGNPSEGVAGHRKFVGEGATGFSVSLFEESNGGVVTAGDAPRYAEDENASPWGSVRQRDDAARKLKSTASSKSDYKMVDLIDHAAHLAGLLAMAAVNYESVNPRMRNSVKEIFKDWNLDYRTVAEWNALMESSAAGRGLLSATAEWWDDLNQNRPNTDQAVIDRIEQDMAVTGFSGRILADFTRTGDTPQSIVNPLQPQARCGRLKRPGAIILPNLNVDTPITLPLPSPLPDRRPDQDALKDNAIAGVSDELGLTEFRLKRPSRAAASGFELALKIHADDARRVRVFEVNSADPVTAWPRRFGADVGGAHTDQFTVAGAASEIDFYVEALTLPGDPLLPAPSVPAPLGRDGVTPVAPSRVKGDVWMELVHRDGGADLPSLTDIGNFTIAPWLMFSNLQPTDKLYVVYLPGPSGNHPTIADLVEGMTAALGAGRVPVGTRPVAGGGSEFVPHQPLPLGEPDRADGVYIIDGSQYGNDVWIQDEIEIGYCWAPHAWTYMTIHVPRKRELEFFVHEHIPANDMGMFDSLDHPWSSINYGGNLEVSPPVEVATAALSDGKAGLAVPDHPRAPLGKILLGEGLIFLFDIDPGLAGSLDAGGVPSSLVRLSFLGAGHRLVNTTITVLTVGSRWEMTITSEADSYEARVTGGVIEVSLRSGGSTTPLFNLDLSFVPDLDAGGIPSERLQAAFLENGSDLPVPRLTVRNPGSEWLITITGVESNWFHRELFMVRSEVATLKAYEARIAEPDFKTFLTTQAVQPVLTFDTSWLHVGHVDEVAIFVPADRDKGHKLLMSSTQLASDIFNAALVLSDPVTHPLTESYRGREWEPGVPAAISVLFLLADCEDVNNELQVERLTPIEDRLKAGLDLTDSDVIRIPVYFHVTDMTLGSIGSGGVTSANTPHMVNLQVVDRHVMVPKPFGPRMRVDDVATILTDLGLAAVTPPRLAPLVGHWHWARKGDLAANMGTTFGVASSAIRSHANNSGKFTGAGAVRNNWDRIWIPEDNVDLLEAYTFIVLTEIGLTIHWIDDWDVYHVNHGEVHCGTNVVRTPPEAVTGFSGPNWWDHYHP